MIRIPTILLGLALASPVVAQENMIVHMKDGSSVKYDMNNVEYVELEATGRGTSEAPASVGGTIGSPVDLGLSVEWADHNVGCSLSSEAGLHYSWDKAVEVHNAWGDAWRVPTDAEWQELYEKCTWTWTVRDGIGGRLVTGPSGKSIFFPATGLSIDNVTHVVGSMGIYWSSTSSAEDATNASASYFDSANIYRMDFPRANTFSVRLVK